MEGLGRNGYFEDVSFEVPATGVTAPNYTLDLSTFVVMTDVAAFVADEGATAERWVRLVVPCAAGAPLTAVPPRVHRR